MCAVLPVALLLAVAVVAWHPSGAGALVVASVLVFEWARLRAAAQLSGITVEMNRTRDSLRASAAADREATVAELAAIREELARVKLAMPNPAMTRSGR